MNLLDWALLFLPVALYSTIQLGLKLLGRSSSGGSSRLYLLTALHLAVALAVLAIFGVRFRAVDPRTVGLAALFGISQLVNIVSMMMAFERGPASYTSLVYTAGLLIPVLAGWIWWGEGIRATQAAALVLLFPSFYLASRRREASGGGAAIDRRWLAPALAAFLSSGTSMLLAKLHQRQLPGGEIREYITIAFAVTAAVSLVLHFATRRRPPAPIPRSHLLSTVVLVAVVGTCNAVANMVGIRLIGSLPAIVVFPVLNGGTVLVVSGLSALLFREHLDRYRAAGLVAGTAGIVLLAMGR